jgi:hypothetical protein
MRYSNGKAMTSGTIKQKWTFLLPFSPENKSSSVILKWSCLLKFKKKSFLWNLLFHALVNYLKMSQNASFWMLSGGASRARIPPHLLSYSRFKFFSLFNTILLNTLLTYMKLIVSYPKILLFQYDASVNHKYKVFNQIIILT